MHVQQKADRRAMLRRLAGPLLLLLIVVLVGLAPIPAFVVTPGPLFDVEDLLRIDGRPVADRIDGDYLFSTIALADADTLDLVRSWVGGEEVMSRGRFIPAGVDEATFVADQQELFRESVRAATAAAAEVADAPGLDVDLETEEVGGPSAGLLIALAAVDALSPADLAAGRRIGGTGEVQADGAVVGVGSVALKLEAAADGGVELFLVPPGQRPPGSPPGLRVVEVATLEEAVAVLADPSRPAGD